MQDLSGRSTTLKNPFAKQPTAADMKAALDDIEAKIARMQPELRAEKDRRANLPFGAATEDLESVNAAIRSKEDMLSALQTQHNSGSRLYLEALASEYDAASARQIDLIKAKAADANRHLKAAAHSLREFFAEQDRLKALGAPLHSLGKSSMIRPSPLQVIRERHRSAFATTGNAPSGHAHDIAVADFQSFAQSREVRVGQDFESTEIARLLDEVATVPHVVTKPRAA
jgi:hypothetical protein